MSLVGNDWGDSVFAAISGLTIPTDRPMTSDEIKAVWRAIRSADTSYLINNTDVNVNSGIACAVDPGTHQGATTANGTGDIS